MSNSTSFSGTLNPPAQMPPQQVQRIKNLRCPPPLQPSKLTSKLQGLYKQLSEEDEQISLLEKQMDDLEKRFAISFSANSLIQYDLKPTQKPYVDISGSLQNIMLGFHMWPARQGAQGLPGPQGDMGISLGQNPVQGITGNPGYYGVRGNNTK